METRYKALRLIATLMKVTGIFIAVLSVFGALSLCGAVTSGGVAFERMLREFGQNSSGLGAFAGLMGGLFAGVVPVVVGGSFALIMYAGGEAVNLQIAIEENTRSMVWYLRYPTQTAPVPSTQMQPGGGDQSTSAVISPKSAGQAQTITSSGSERHFCPQCGTKIEPTDEQCANCGQALV
jgi:hypothetical protein